MCFKFRVESMEFGLKHFTSPRLIVRDQHQNQFKLESSNPSNVNASNKTKLKFVQFIRLHGNACVDKYIYNDETISRHRHRKLNKLININSNNQFNV